MDETKEAKKQRTSPRPRTIRTRKEPERQRAEKQRIHGRLLAFRKEWGLGGYAYLEELSGGKVPAEILRDMANGGKYPIKLWQEAEKLLNRVMG